MIVWYGTCCSYGFWLETCHSRFVNSSVISEECFFFNDITMDVCKWGVGRVHMLTKYNLTHKCVHLKSPGWSLSLSCIIFSRSFISLVPGFPVRYPYKVKAACFSSYCSCLISEHQEQATQSFPRLKSEVAITCYVNSVFKARMVMNERGLLWVESLKMTMGFTGLWATVWFRIFQFNKNMCWMRPSDWNAR